MYRTLGLTIVVLALTLGSAQARGQGTLWQSYRDAGWKALERSDYDEAHKFFLAALREAEAFGPNSIDYVTSYNDLAEWREAGAKADERK